MREPVGAVRSGGESKLPAAVTPARCPSVRAATTFYRNAYISWRLKMDAPAEFSVRSPGCSRHILWVSVLKARAARRSYQRWLQQHTLSDFEVRPGNNAWFRAIEEAQKIFPGTAWWLKSCSATEGGWGRWVPNSDGAPPGGWMQMYESTFWRMWKTAKTHAQARGFRVPRSAASWYSPLGQALASAWGLTNGRRGEWNSSGC